MFAGRTLRRVSGVVPSLAAASLAASALASPPVVPSPLRPTDAGGPVVALTFDAAAYRAIKSAGAATIADFPLPGGAVTLEVEPLDVFAGGAQLVLGTANGPVALARPDLVLLSGSVADEPGSRVYLSLSPSAVNGYVIRGGTTFIVSSGPPGKGLPTVIYDPATLPPGAIDLVDVSCGADRLPVPPARKAMPARAGSGGGTQRAGICREATLAIDSDWEYSGTIFGGNTGAASAYIATLVGAVSEIYHNEFNTTLKIGYLRVWSSNTDPYSAGDVYNRLFEFKDFWNANMTAIQRNAAHCFSGLHAGGTGGVAYLPGLCQQDFDYGASGYINGSFPYPLEDHNSQNWDVMVTAHEMGHNFGAPHTHSTTPPIDNCGNGDCSQAFQGTIMSYCHTCSGGMTNISLTMHTRIVNENILPYLDNEAPCNLGVTPVSISDQPDSQTVPSGSFAFMSATAAGSPPLSYQWYKGATPVDGATTSQYYWAPALPSDSGSYTVRVSNSCGTVESSAAILTVTPCPADYNEDGFVDGLDYDLFNNDFESQDPGQQMNADFNGDGFVDGIDYDQFNNAFEAGC